MSVPLQLLLVEDSPDDAELILAELKSGGYEPHWKRVETEEDYLAQLKRRPDVILSDYAMPQFSGLRAVQLLRQSGLDIPFVLISGTLGEEAAVAAMKEGVTDYLLKDRIGRLGSVVKHALEQKQLRAAHLAAQQQIQLQADALEAAANAIIITDRTGRILSANRAFCTMTGYSVDEVLGKNPRLLKSGQHDAEFYQQMWETILAGRVWRGEMSNRRKNHSVYHEEMTITPVRSAEGEITHFIAVKQDITERNRVNTTLNLFRMLMDRSNDGIEVIDPASGRFLDVNERTCLRLGYAREELLSMTVPEVDPKVLDRDPWPKVVEEIRQAGFKFFETKHRRKDGTTFPVEVNVRYVKLDREYLIAAVRDITDRRQAERALHHSEEKFRQLAENIDEVFWMTDPAKNEMLYVSPAYERIWGWSCESLYRTPQTWADAIHPDDRARVMDAAAHKQVEGTYDEEYRIVRMDKSVRWIRDRAFPVRDSSGHVERVVGVATDITDRRKLEEEFRQSQKMEAIGQLASGVAHDFNNILAVILMQTNILSAGGSLNPDQKESTESISKAALHAANLTRQLLLFGRRQVMQVRNVNLNDSVGEIGKLLGRILGEDIHLQAKFTSRLPLIRADASMIDQVLMNLAVNSRDAMPKGGELVIETCIAEFDELSVAQVPRARPGTFVCLAVSDTGTGIAAEVLPKIFDPFFTTKDVGKGTGLSLATVFGIVHQHQGWINVYTEEGRGTTFRVYFPCQAQPGERSPAQPAAKELRGGNETILLVEDDSSLRPLIQNALIRLGYHVLAAASGIEACKVWDKHRDEIHLLLTDLVMPGGTNGRELALKLLEQKPGLKVVYSSGYSAEIMGKDFPMEEGVNFLSKPFEVSKLANALRQSLDGGK
jgi:two-component system cell cycle sensor histidine kinase/response regulator CckA